MNYIYLRVECRKSYHDRVHRVRHAHVHAHDQQLLRWCCVSCDEFQVCECEYARYKEIDKARVRDNSIKQHSKPPSLRS